MSSYADATAMANLGSSGNPGAPQNPRVSGIVDATSQASSSTGGSAYAYANLNTGILRDVGVSDNLFPLTTTSTADSSISDSLTFSAGVGMTAYLDYMFDGTLNVLSTVPSAASAQMVVSVTSIGGAVRRYETLSAFAANCGAGTNCEVGTSTMRTGSVAFQIFNGSTSFIMGLSGNASMGNSFNFGNTAKFYLRLPEGVTYTSASGNFLTAAAPIFAVPEPSTWAMLAVGMGMLAAKRRRSQDA
jgi:hypothetical protein